MRSGALLCAAALGLGACYDDAPGVTLVIKDPGFGAHEVELFLATRSATTHEIGADESRGNEERGKLRGDAFFLDGPRDGITPITELPIVDGQVVWNLQADPDGPRKVKVAVAVAYDGQGEAVAIATMRDLEIPRNEAVAYVVGLEAATQIAPSDSMEPPGARVWPWRKTSAPATAACLGLEHSNGADRIERIWLVPEDDPDCDEFEIECDEHLHHADFSDVAHACVVPATTSNGVNVPCQIGSKVCEDGVSAGECVVSPTAKYCLANAFCDPDLCAQDPMQCQRTDTSRVECAISFQQDGQVCDEQTLGTGPVEVVLSSSAGLFPGGCQAIAFASNDMSAGVISSPSIAVDGATFTLEDFVGPECSFSIRVSGQYDVSLGANGVPIVLALDITRASNHFVIPTFITINLGNCPSVAATCTPIRSSMSELGGCL